MKNYIPCIFIFLLFNFATHAQESTIIVLNVKGQVDYLKDQSGAKERLLPGMKIAASGALNLAKDAKVNLLSEGKRVQLDEQGAYDLKTLFEKNDKQLSMSFAGRFWDFVSDGLSHSEDEESLDHYSERILSIAGGVKGYAASDSELKVIMPASGKIGLDLVTFNWHRLKSDSVFYHFKIYDTEHNDLVFKAIIRDTSITLDFSQLVFHTNKTYEWQIETEQKNKIAGKNLVIKSDFNTFEYFPKIDEIIAQKAQYFKEYKAGNHFQKQWMEAIILEQENFIYAAYARYTDLQRQHPENLLVKKLFASFLVRQGLTEEAMKFFK